jgi:SNF2 family DNA or RNA helicase
MVNDLWQHQKECIERARGKNYYGILFEVGTGKTRTVIEIMRERFFEHKRILRTLIVCPLIVTRNWPSEIEKYSNIERRNVFVLEGTGTKRVETLALKVLPDPNKIVVVNYEGVMMPKLLKMLEIWKPEMIIADEMHYMKNPSAKRSKIMISLSRLAKYRFGLTGTPILNNPMDIFSQWMFLDHGATFGDNYYAFRGKYFQDKNAKMPKHLHFPKWEIRPSALEDISVRLENSSMSVKKEDALDLPPLIKQIIPVDLSPKQKKHYEEMRDDFITHIRETGEAALATNGLVKALRLMQICSGFLKDEGENIVDFKDNPKAHALEELLESIQPHKTIVWCVFKNDYEVVRKVCNKLKIKYVECSGETPNSRKFDNVDAFNKDESVKVFIGHPKSLGIGINLIAGKFMIFYSRSFALGDDIQAEARNYRGGSEVHDKITRYDIVASGTIDERCVEALHAKKQIGDAVIKSWVDNI